MKNSTSVISSRALHHFTENQRRRYIFKEVFDLLRVGGCFINADNVRAATKSLTERYRSARDEYLDRYDQTVERRENQSRRRQSRVAEQLITARTITVILKKSWRGCAKRGFRTSIAFGNLLRRWCTAGLKFNSFKSFKTCSERESLAYCFKTQPDIVRIPTTLWDLKRRLELATHFRKKFCPFGFCYGFSKRLGEDFEPVANISRQFRWPRDKFNVG